MYRLAAMGVAGLRLFGGVELKTSSGSAVPIPRKKAQALLAYLACHPGHAQPRDKLATLFWPEMEDDAHRHCQSRCTHIQGVAAPTTTTAGRSADDRS